MYIRNSAKYGKDIKIIHPGEYHVSRENEIIGTLLGSCIAVCLIDRKNGVAGMNHFMLPGRITRNDLFSDKSAKYGITAINNLLTDVERAGAVKKNLIAKVYGGGHVLGPESGINAIPSDNIRIALIMMELEDIHVEHTDVGDDYTRKLMMDVKTGKIYLKKTTRKDVIDDIIRRDVEYARRIGL